MQDFANSEPRPADLFWRKSPGLSQKKDCDSQNFSRGLPGCFDVYYNHKVRLAYAVWIAVRAVIACSFACHSNCGSLFEDEFPGRLPIQIEIRIGDPIRELRTLWQYDIATINLSFYYYTNIIFCWLINRLFYFDIIISYCFAITASVCCGILGVLDYYAARKMKNKY